MFEDSSVQLIAQLLLHVQEENTVLSLNYQWNLEIVLKGIIAL